MSQLEARQEQERSLLDIFLQTPADEDLKLWAEASSLLDRRDRLGMLTDKRVNTDMGTYRPCSINGQWGLMGINKN